MRYQCDLHLVIALPQYSVLKLYRKRRGMQRQGLRLCRTIYRRLEDGKSQGLRTRWQHSSARTKTTATEGSGQKMNGPSIDEPMPRPALVLGLSGTIPFFASAGVAVSTGDPALAATACHACVAYGCSILSFLGAVHWGIAIRSATTSATRTPDFLYSVTPSLAAAAAAVLPDDQALTILLPAFGAALVYGRLFKPCCFAHY